MNKANKSQKDSKASRKVDLDTAKPLDVEKAVDLLNGNRKLYMCMLSKIEVHSLNTSLIKMATAYNEQDWAKMKMLAHTLKSCSGYVGAG